MQLPPVGIADISSNVIRELAATACQSLTVILDDLFRTQAQGKLCCTQIKGVSALLINEPFSGMPGTDSYYYLPWGVYTIKYCIDYATGSITLKELLGSPPGGGILIKIGSALALKITLRAVWLFIKDKYFNGGGP